MFLAFLMGVVTGLRSLTAPAAVSWGVRLGWVHAELPLLGGFWTSWVLTALAVGELIADQLPSTPSRKAPIGFGARLAMGALCGMALAAVPGLIAGVVGAVVGTLGGYEFRARLAKAIGKDLPAALIEDAIAIGAAFLIVAHV